MSSGIKNHGRHERNVFLAVCLIPTFVLYFIFMILPTLNVFQLSLYKWSGLLGEKKFIGLDNFVTMFQSDKFWLSFRNTLFFMVFTTFFTIILALFFATVLSKSKIRGKSFYRIVFYFPNILSVVIIAAIFNNLYAAEKGALNVFLSTVGLGKYTHMWLSDRSTVLYAISFAMIWQAVGYYMVMYVAGMDSIPNSLYECADLEGASGWTKFFKITLPLTWEVVRVTLTFFVISSINMSFLFVKAMTNGQPDGASDVLLNMMYFEAYNNSHYGYGMAIGAFLFIFSFVVSLIVQKLTDREPVTYQ